MCGACEKVFCMSCLQSYGNAKNVCPYNCPNPTYNKAPRLVIRAIMEMKICCQFCKGIYIIETIDKHEAFCGKPKCACFDCDKLESEIKQVIKVEEVKCCSLICKYVYLIGKSTEKSLPPAISPADKDKILENSSKETRKIVVDLIKDSEIHKDCKPPALPIKPFPHPKPMPAPMSAPMPAPMPVPMPVPVPQPLPSLMQDETFAKVPGPTDFRWDPETCAANIVLSEGNTLCFLQEGGYCFRSVVGNVGFQSGIHYWEVHADSRTENELKIGIACKKNFNLNTAFCDYEYGWGYYGLGQLRHGNNSAGPKYGKTFKNTGYLGIYLDMIKGQLSFSLNGEYLGIAFKEEALKKPPLFPAVSLLHKAGCKLVVGKPIPTFFV